MPQAAGRANLIQDERDEPATRSSSSQRPHYTHKMAATPPQVGSEPADCAVIRALPFSPFVSTKTPPPPQSCCNGYTTSDLECNNGRITALTLDNENKATGRIFNEQLMGLTELEKLSIWNVTNTSGQRWTFPVGLDKLTKLKTLSVVNASLTGEIPGPTFAALTKLESLTLAVNSLNGTIPTQIGELPNLQKLYGIHPAHKSFFF